MTQLLDRPVAGGATLYRAVAPASPSVQAAEDFYVRGATPIRRIVVHAVGDARALWLAAYMEGSLNSLLKLDPGWDGRRAREVSEAAVRAAVEVTSAVVGDLSFPRAISSFPPQVFPLPDGGLQLEWHAGGSVEIEIDGSGAAHVLVVDEDRIALNEELQLGDPHIIDQTRTAIHDLSTRLAVAWTV